MPSLTTLRYLLVVTAVTWAAFPTWGAIPFLSALVLMGLGTAMLVRRARAVLAPHLTSLDDDAARFANTYAVTALWPESAQRWGESWQILGPLALFEGVIFFARTLLTWDWWLFLLLIPVGLQLLLGGAIARFFHMEERLNDDLSAHRATWLATKAKWSLQRTLDLWPPEPAPDVETPPAEPPKA